MAHELASIFIEQCGKNPKKRAFRIMYPDLSYKEAMKHLRCSTLYERREDICLKTMNRIEQSGGHLSRLLTLTRDNAHNHDLRNNNSRTPFFCKTIRYQNSFFPALVDKLNSNELV